MSSLKIVIAYLLGSKRALEGLTLNVRVKSVLEILALPPMTSNFSQIPQLLYASISCTESPLHIVVRQSIVFSIFLL